MRPREPAPAAVRGESSLRDDGDSRHLEMTFGHLELRHSFEGIVGRSGPMTKALAILDRVADRDEPVLLTGETGTGKEVFARALHAASRRAKKPFVAVNCSAVPGTLFEAELFGHQRGAFTGATRDHVGYVREAEGGVLFLDEIADLPLELQPKLLRMLEEKRVRPIGGDRDVPVDVRLVAATNRDLAADVERGRFRADLYYRINVVELRLPPLRERTQDLPELVRHLASRTGRDPDRVSASAMAKLLDYDWPGNVRELENEIRRAYILAAGGPVEERHLSPRIRELRREHFGRTGRLATQLLAEERRLIAEALALAKNNRSQAARALGMSRGGLFRKMQRLGMLR
jgi:two-component system response regulator HydG